MSSICCFFFNELFLFLYRSGILNVAPVCAYSKVMMNLFGAFVLIQSVLFRVPMMVNIDRLFLPALTSILSRIFSGKIKIWDLQAALDPRSQTSSLCIKTLTEHTGRVFRLQFDEFQIVSSSHDDSILCFNFLQPDSSSEQHSSPVLGLSQTQIASFPPTTTAMDSSANGNLNEMAGNALQSQASVQSTTSTSSGSGK